MRDFFVAPVFRLAPSAREEGPMEGQTVRYPKQTCRRWNE